MFTCSQAFRILLVLFYGSLAILLLQYQNTDLVELSNRFLRATNEDDSITGNSLPFRSPTYDVYHDYCIYYNVISPIYREYDRISQILHMSSNLLDNRIIDQVLNWNAPISLAILLNDISDYSCTLNKLHDLINDNPSVRQYLSVHLVYPQNWTADCVLVSEPACREVTKSISIQKIADYPANIIRNIARMYVPSKYILIADLEHLFTINFEADVRRIAERVMADDPKRLLVYRIFEINSNIENLPQDKAQLFSLFKDGKAVVFHDRYYRGAHNIEGLDMWFQNKQNSSGVSVSDYPYTSSAWEPQFISLSNIPLHDELFPFLIRDNTELRWELCRAGYKLDILSEHFMFHRGIKTKAAGLISRKIQQINAERFQTALKAFDQKMAKMYPSTSDKCPTFRAK